MGAGAVAPHVGAWIEIPSAVDQQGGPSCPLPRSVIVTFSTILCFWSAFSKNAHWSFCDRWALLFMLDYLLLKLLWNRRRSVMGWCFQTASVCRENRFFYLDIDVILSLLCILIQNIRICPEFVGQDQVVIRSKSRGSRYTIYFCLRFQFFHSWFLLGFLNQPPT